MTQRKKTDSVFVFKLQVDIIACCQAGENNLENYKHRRLITVLLDYMEYNTMYDGGKILVD